MKGEKRALAAADIKLSKDDVEFIRYRYFHAKNKRKMLEILSQLFLIPKERVVTIVGEKLSEEKREVRFWTAEEDRFVIDSIEKPLEACEYKALIRMVEKSK